MDIFEGAYTALVTPFRDGQVDEPALRDLVDFQIEEGIHGLVPCGTTGESPTITVEEHVRTIRIVVEQARGRVPVIGGAGNNCTRSSIALATQAKEAGVDGVMLVCPYYNRPDQRGLEAHFRAVMNAVDLPTMLYNVPKRTGSDLHASTIEKLCDVPHFLAVKEASGHVLRTQEIVARTGGRLRVLSGEDALTFAILAEGGAGVVSVTSNAAPRLIAALYEHARDGQWNAARDAHQALLPLHDAMFSETNPGPVKAALVMMNRIQPEIRMPLLWPTEATETRLRSTLESHQLL